MQRMLKAAHAEHPPLSRRMPIAADAAIADSGTWRYLSKLCRRVVHLASHPKYKCFNRACLCVCAAPQQKKCQQKNKESCQLETYPFLFCFVNSKTGIVIERRRAHS
jgi:hypothetical protein